MREGTGGGGGGGSAQAKGPAKPAAAAGRQNRGRPQQRSAPRTERKQEASTASGRSRTQELLARSRKQTAEIREQQAIASGDEAAIEAAKAASAANEPVLPSSPSVGEAGRIRRGPSAAEKGLVPSTDNRAKRPARSGPGGKVEPENVFQKKGTRRKEGEPERPRRRKSSPNQQRRRPGQPAIVQKRTKKLDVSRHLYYKVDVREIFAEEDVPEEFRANLLAFTWSKGERQGVEQAITYVREQQDQDHLSERAADRIVSVLKRYTTRRS